MVIVDKNGAFQGDVALFPIDELPAHVERVAPEKGLFIVTHSETGHHHAIKERPGIELFRDTMDEFRSYLVINDPDPADLEHLRDYHTHETQRFDPAVSRVWQINRQVQPGPEGWQRVAD